MDDLIAFGQVGLAEAARDFNPARGNKFTTYAFYRIRGAILDGLSKMGWFSRHHYHSRRYESMANEVMRLDSEGESKPGATLVDSVRGLGRVAGSLAVVYLATRGERDEENGAPSIADESTPSPAAQAIEREMRDTLRELVEALPSDARSLIEGVYYEGLTLQDAGARVGISKAWASRLHAKTLQRLAHSLRLIGADEGG
jgi:RNA polymerase sigma factor for flagellar operon FliA